MNRNSQNTQRSRSASADGLPQPGPSRAVGVQEEDALLAQLAAITALPVGDNLFYAPDLLTESYTQQHLSSSSSSQPYMPSFPSGLPWPSMHQGPYNDLPIASSSTMSPSSPDDTPSPAGLNHANTGMNSPTFSAGADGYSDTERASVDDKRRRNTMASARFRVKKKLKTINLERSVSDLTGRAEELEREAADLRRENGWLKEIVMLKGTHLAALNLAQQLHSASSERQRSRTNRAVSPGEEQRDESEDEKEKRKGKERLEYHNIGRHMSFGRPPSINVGFKPNPPDRGSFPLDHDGECKEKMMLYMNCLRQNSGTSTPCRAFSKDYLDCRMEKGLMERDEWRNLGLANVQSDNQTTADAQQKSTETT